MDNPFDSPRMLMQEAEENIASLEEIVKTFLGNQNEAGGFDQDPKTGKYLLYVQFSQPIPAKISMVIRAAARDLRDALDHAVYASAVSLLGGDPKRTKFLAADEERFITDDLKRGRCKDVHQDVIDLMLKEKAHKTGNRTLWTLNHFRNHNTHKVVSLANAGSQGFGINSGSAELKDFTTISDWRSTSRRLYFAQLGAKSKFKFRVTPATEIRLHNSFAAGDRPASAFLRDALEETTRITDGIEAETYRIKKGSP